MFIYFLSCIMIVTPPLLPTLHLTDQYSESCPASQAFSYKLQRCQLTCRSLGSERQTCTSNFLPVDGCSCPEGLYVDNNGMCVPMAKCPCYHNGEHVKPGKSISIKDNHWLVLSIMSLAHNFGGGGGMHSFSLCSPSLALNRLLSLIDYSDRRGLVSFVDVSDRRSLVNFVDVMKDVALFVRYCSDWSTS